MLHKVTSNYGEIARYFPGLKARLSSSARKKQLLLEMARRGEKRPVAGTTMGNVFRNYTTTDNDCYDRAFDIKVRKLAPHWFVSASESMNQKKKLLLDMAKKGELKPSVKKTKIGHSLFGYTSPKSKTYDPDFTREIKKLAPHWFVPRREIMRQKKQLLLDMARRGERKPQNSTKLGSVLSKYVNPKNKSYDPGFAKKIKRLAPHWLVSRSQIAGQKKNVLLKMAARGESKPKSETTLDKALHSYLRKDSSSYDPVFARKIKKTRPDWFVSRSRIAEQKKRQLLALAKKGGPRPKQQRHPLGNVLGAYTRETSDSYDPVFARKIKKLRPDWFTPQTLIADGKKRSLLAMASRRKTKPKRNVHPLGQALADYTCKVSKTYDPKFAREIRRLAPHWFRRGGPRTKGTGRV